MSWTPLHEAVYKTRTAQAVRSALRGDADVKTKDKWGYTAVHLAVWSSRQHEADTHAPVEVVNALLAAPGVAEAMTMKASEGDHTPLHCAVLGKAPVQIVQAMLSAPGGAEAVKVRDKWGQLPIHLAVWSRDEKTETPHAQLAVVNALLSAPGGADALGSKAEDGDTPLHRAFISNAPVPVVRALLAAPGGAEALMEKNGKGATPLHVAAWNGHNSASLEVVRALLATPGAANAAEMKDEDGHTPLERAVAFHAPREIVRAFRSVVYAALHEAASKTMTVQAVRRALRDDRVDVNAKDEWGRNALYLAALKKAPLAVVNFLLQAGADPLAKSDGGITAIHAAVVNYEGSRATAPNVRLVDALLAGRSTEWVDGALNEKDKDGHTPLHLAACYCKRDTTTHAGCEVVDALLAAPGGADVVKSKDNLGRTPLHRVLHLAAATVPIEVVRALLAAPGGGDAMKDNSGQTPLHYAARLRGTLRIVEALLATPGGAGALLAKDNEGRTPLHLAVYANAHHAENAGRGDETLRALIEAGSDLDAGDKSGNTALHFAALHHAPPPTVRELRDAGASMFVENNAGNTPADLFGGCFFTLRHDPFRSPIFWSLAFAVASFVGGLLWGWIDSLLGLPGHPMWLWSLLFTCVGEGIIKAAERRSGLDFVLTPGSRFRLERFALLLVGFATFCWMLDTLVFGYTVFPTDAQPTGFSVLMHVYNSKFGKETLGLTSPFASARFVSVFTEFGLIATFLSPATLYLLARRNLEAEALKRLFAGFTILPPLLNLVGAFVATFIFAHRAYSAVESRGWQYVSPVEGPMMDLLNGIALPSFLTMFMALGIDAFRVASRTFVVGLSVFALVLAAWQSYFFGYEVPSNVAFEIRSSCDRNTMEAFMMKMAARATETEYVEPDADVWAGNANSFCLGLKAFSWSALIASGHNAYLMLMLVAAAVRLTDREGAKLALVTENTRRAYLPAGRVAADGLPEAVSGADAAKVFLSICRRSRGGGEAPAAAADNRPPAVAADNRPPAAAADGAVHVAIDGEAAEVPRMDRVQVELEIGPDDAAARHPQTRGPWRREVDDESGQTQYYNTETRERRPECNANASLYARGVAPPRFNRSHCFGLFAQLAVLIVACFTIYVAVNEITKN